MIAILDEQGIALSTASVQFSPDARVMLLSGVNERGLLDYFFSRGRRRVVIDLGAVRFEGRLDTRWDGNCRRWLVAADAPAVVPAAPDATVPYSEPPVRAGVTRPLAIAS